MRIRDSRSESYGSGCAGFQFTQTSKELGFKLGLRNAGCAAGVVAVPGSRYRELWVGDVWGFGALGLEGERPRFSPEIIWVAVQKLKLSYYIGYI